MKSIKTRLMLNMLILVVISTLFTATIALVQGFAFTKNIVEKQFKDQLVSTNSMLKVYLNDQFGALSINAGGQMIDSKGQPVEGQYQSIDKLSENMNVVSTLFAKNGDQFVRVLTTITDENGQRVLGTLLDPKGKAYAEIINGNAYFGEAEILNHQYMTAYDPLFNENKELIGICFVGVPIETVNRIVNQEILSSTLTVAAWILFVLLIVLIISYYVSSSIAKPIKKITVAAQQIANGDFNVELSVYSKDEIGHLANAFNKTITQLENYQGYIDEIADALHTISHGNLSVQLQRAYSGQFVKLKENIESLSNNLNSTLLLIQASSMQVDNNAEQVSTGAQALAQGATEQACSIQELSASIMDISAKINHNADNAKTAQKKAELAGQEVQSSNGMMKEMVDAMDNINKKSSEISKIIKIIDDIAFQTNILALNAAVEAARAGNAGKGFAVVADEVRSLAGKSAEAAKNTSDLISDTLNAVNRGSKLALNTAASLEKSAEETNAAILLIDQIATASNEQATAILHINQGVEQISTVVQTNAATAEESAAASQELSSQSELLQDLIAKFTLIQSESNDLRM